MKITRENYFEKTAVSIILKKNKNKTITNIFINSIKI